MKKYILIIIALIAVLQLKAQYSVKVGTENSGSVEWQPCNNQYEYGWSATVYKQSDINSYGTISDIFYKSSLLGAFGPGANTFMFNQRIFMKLVTDDAMTSNAFPDTTAMTLVYAGMVEFLNYELAPIHLDTPFDIDLNHNLMILYINKSANKELDSDHFLLYPTEHDQTTNNTVYNTDDGSFPGGAGIYTSHMPVVYLKYAPGLDIGISAVNETDTFTLPQQADLTCKFRNYMADTITSADIEWELSGTPQTTFNWAGTIYCGQESETIVLQNNFAFAPGQYSVKANTTNPNSGTDELNTNDTINTTIRVADNKILAYNNYSDNKIPFLSNNGYGWSASIYNKDYINFSGKIQSIAYYLNSEDGNLLGHQKIYMKLTNDDLNPSTNYPDTAQFIKVFDGDIDYTSIGWITINLDTVFDYDKSQNLMILYENHSGTPTPIAINFKTGWVHTDAIYNYDLNAFPTGAGSVAGSSRVPALQLFFSIPKDAGVTKLAGSDTPVNSGDNDFIIDFKNFGLDILQDVDLKYKIDEETENLYHWNGTVNPQNEITNLNIGTFNLTYGDHLVKIWTENPNYLPDYVNRNDTLKVSLRACSPLSGTYVIGNAPSDFLTIKAAIDSLNNCGVNNAVIFNIKSGTYNNQYLLNEVAGVSETNTITFQSQTGDSTDVILTTDSTDYLFNLNGADYLRFKHLAFSSDSAVNFVLLDSNACNNTFSGNIFTSNNLSSTFIYSGAYNDSNLVFQNNRFINGGNGIYLHGNTETEQSVNISNNIFTNQYYNSIGLEYCNNPIVSNNEIVSHTTGIYLKESTNININANDIRLNNANNGIFLDHCQGDETNRNYITNNFISGNISSAWNHSGIGLFYSSSFTNVYYNSINITGTEQAVYLYITDNINLVNNIIINKNNNPIKVQSPTSLNSDYNCFYSENSSFNLSTCQSATGIDTHSIYESPYFVSNSDLHTNSLFIDNAGTSLPEITDDIDGEPRDATNPDIGADEFTSTCTGPISGTYTIGSSGDYTTFNEAVSALFECGVNGSVIFNIEAGTYNEQILINKDISGYTENDTITFQSETADSTSVILTYKADTLNNYTLKLNGADRFVFKQITIQAEDTICGRVIEIGNGACNNSIQNCIISGDISDEDNNYQALVYFPADNTSRDTSNIIQGNRFVNGSYGIYLDGGNNDKETFNTISGNYFTNQSAYGVYAHYQKNLLIEKNTIENNYQLDINYSGIGIVFDMDSTIITKNIININRDYNSYGLHIEGYNNLVLNNFITLKSNDYHSTGIYGLGTNSKCYNNSVNIYGSSSPVALDVTYSTSNAEIKNNNFANHADGYALKCMFGWSQILSADFNNLYSNGEYIANWLNAGIVDLADWQTASGFGSNSVSSNPNFVSNTDLHTSNVLLNNAATPLPEVTDDIDGEPRDATTPDIGADEFTSLTFSLGDDATACVDAEYKIDAGEGFDTYSWSTGTSSSYVLVDSTDIGYGSEEYFVTVTLGAEQYNDTIIVTFSSPIAAPVNYFCYDENTDSVLITAGDGLYYNWSTGETTQSIWTTSDVSVTVTDANGCQDSDYINSQWNSCIANFTMPDDTTICNNDSIVIDANSYCEANYANYSYYWNTGDTTETITVYPDDISSEYNEYSVEIIYSYSGRICTTYDTVNVYKNVCPANLDMPNDTTIALNKSIVLDANSADCSSNYSDYIYQWSTGETAETITVNGADLGLGGPFEISVTVINNLTNSRCQTSDAVNINITNADAIKTIDKNNIKIFPNPSKGIVKIKFNKIINNGTIELVNITGQIIYSEEFENLSGVKELDFSDFNNGVYFVKLYFDNEIIKKKIVLY